MFTSDTHWSKWGRDDPYYAVLTAPEFRKQELAAHVDRFFETGDIYVETLLERIERHFGPVSRRRALDFGCGVGRIALPLARRFEEVVGVDIAEAMLVEAEANSARQGIDNLTFALSDDSLSRVSGSFSLINTYIVLQHVRAPRGMQIIERLLQLTELGGAVALHMSVRRKIRFHQEAAYLLRHFVPGGNALFNFARRRPVGEPPMLASEYDPIQVLQRLEAHGFPQALVSLEDHNGISTMTFTAMKTR